MSTTEPIGKRIRTRRVEMGLSQRALAEQVGMSHAHVSLVETGRSDISRAMLAQVAAALQLSVEELLGEPAPRSTPPTITGVLTVEETQIVLAHRRMRREHQRALQTVARGLGLLDAEDEVATKAAEPRPTYPTAQPETGGLRPLELPPRAEQPMTTLRLVGYVAAGAPWPDEELLDEVDVPTGLVTAGCMAMRVKGYSLVLDGVLDGDLLIVDRADWNYRKGQTVVAAVNDAGRWGMVVKRYGGQKKGVITLKSAHPSQPDITGRIKEEIEIRAIVRHVWRS